MKTYKIMIDWTELNYEDTQLIKQIVKRANATLIGGVNDKMSAEMDIAAVHLTIGLRLEEFLNADNLNFSHDFHGIVNNIDRNNGELLHCFLPRFSKH